MVNSHVSEIHCRLNPETRLNNQLRLYIQREIHVYKVFNATVRTI